MAKLMISFREANFRLLTDEAKDRGITIQELIRAVIVPDWVRGGNGIKRDGSIHPPLEERQRQELSPIFIPKLGKSPRIQ